MLVSLITFFASSLVNEAAFSESFSNTLSILANLLDNIVIQGNVTIVTFDEETEDMVVLWETEDFEYDSFNIPYGIATAEVIYMNTKNKPIDEYGELVIEVRFTEE